MTATTIPPGWKPLRAEGFMDHIGPLLRSTEMAERMVFGFQTNDTHRNPLGLVHGGVLASVLDHAVAIAGWEAADRQPVVTVQMSTRMTGSARPGDLLEIRPVIRQTTGSMVFVDAQINVAERAIADTTAVLKIVAFKGAA